MERESFNVCFSSEAYEKIRAMNEIADTFEWSAFLIGEIKEGSFKVEDLLVPAQTVWSASVNVDDDKLSALVEKLMKESPSTLPRIRGYIHSHNTMDTFHSSTDEGTNDRYEKYIANNSIFISVVVNNAMKMVAKAIIRVAGNSLQLDGIPISAERPPSAMKDAMAAIWADRIEKGTYVYSTVGTGTNITTEWYKSHHGQYSEFVGWIPDVSVLTGGKLAELSKLIETEFRFGKYATYDDEITKGVSKINAFKWTKTERKNAKDILISYMKNVGFTNPMLLGLKTIDVKEYRKLVKKQDAEIVADDEEGDAVSILMNDASVSEDFTIECECAECHKNVMSGEIRYDTIKGTRCEECQEEIEDFESYNGGAYE